MAAESLDGVHGKVNRQLFLLIRVQLDVVLQDNVELESEQFLGQIIFDLSEAL